MDRSVVLLGGAGRRDGELARDNLRAAPLHVRDDAGAVRTRRPR
jgi:hypothetical protein